MEKEAREQLYNEETNWLNRSRTQLMDALLKKAGVAHKQGTFLDIGAGSGHAIEVLSKYGEVDAIEVAPEAWPLIQKKPVRNLYKTPVPNDEVKGPYNAIIGLEVLEHIEDDKAAMLWLAERLETGGHLILSVPAYQWLFGAHDVANHHYRRYTRKRLLEVLPDDLDLIQSGYFMTSLFPAAAAARLAYNMKHNVKKTSGGQDTPPPKQKSSLPALVEALFSAMMRLEAFLVRKGFTAPFGMTVYLLVCKK